MSVAIVRKAKRDMLRELVPVRAFASAPDEHLFLLEDGGLGFGFLCQPLSGADQGASDRLNVLLTQDWPKGTVMQVGLWTGPDIEITLENMLRLRGMPREDMTPAQASIASRHAFLRESTEHPVIPNTQAKVRNIQNFVTVSLPGAGNEMPKDKLVKQAKELRKAVSQTLKTAGMAPVALNASRYLRLMNTILNPHQGATWRDTTQSTWDKNAEIRDQILDIDHRLESDANGINLGPPEDRTRVTTMSIKRLPKYINFGTALAYLSEPVRGMRGIHTRVLATATLVFQDAEAASAKLERNHQWATNQAAGALVMFNPRLKEKKEDYDALFDALGDGDRPVRLALSFSLFTDPDGAPEAISNAQTYFRETGFALMRDRFISLPTFIMSLPLCADAGLEKPMMRFHTMATRHAIALLPLFGDWKGTQRPMLNFISRNGQLMNYDLFYEGGGNYNALVCAQSGSGKSVLMNELISSYLSSGARAWVIDVGRSYKKLCENFGGQFIEFSDESNVCLNPFTIIQDFDDEVEVVCGIIESMAAPRQSLTDFQSAQLQKTLKALWERKGRDSSIDDLEQMLLEHDDKRIRDIGHQLFLFTSKGAYGHFFAGENTISFNNNLVVLELEELKSRAHLQQVVLFMLIYQIQQGMFQSGTEQQKLLMIDEGWDLLTSGDTGKFMENSYRRVRKNNGSATIATQGLLDLDNTSGGRAIVENSASTLLLAMKAETVNNLREKKALDLTEFGFSVLKTVHTEPGVYSEIFLSTAIGMGVGRLILEPFKQLLYSTNPNDLQDIKKYREQGLSINDAIWAVVEERKSNAQQ